MAFAPNVIAARPRWLVWLALVACRGSSHGGLVSGTPVDAAPSLAVGPDASPEASAPSTTCVSPGCLRTAKKIGDYTKAQLVPTLDRRVSIDNGYSVWSIEYTTADRTSFATVAMPFGVDAPVRGWAIVANNHGTTGVDDACALTGTVFGDGLAGLFAARGMIGVATDYPGLGTPGVHPYLVSEVEGRASLDALRAARALARWQSVRTSDRYAVVGLSQGGHATLAAAALHKKYAPELDVRAFAATAPASVFEEQWRVLLTADGAHVPRLAMMIYAWMEHYGYKGPPVWAPGVEPALRVAMSTRCAYAMNGKGALADALGTERAKIFAPAFVTAYSSGTWGPYASFSQWFSANRVAPYPQTAPLKIYQGDADDVVPEAGTRALVGALRAGGVVVDYEVVPGGAHGDVAHGFVAAFERRTADSIAWIRGRVASE